MHSRQTRNIAVVTTGLLMLLFTLLCAGQALAATTAAGDTDAATQHGGLMLSGPGVATSIPALRLGTDIDVTVTGASQRVVVTQAFRNTSNRWLAGEYLYPLPDDAAVDSLKMVVGDRVIIGHIKKREQARQIYEQAKQQGRKASLVEQQRPNLFTNHIANIGPGETVLVAIEFQAPVRQSSGHYALRLPLVAAPRYVSPQSLQSPADIADARAATAAPVLDPKLGQDINPVSITVHLQPGFTPAQINSPSHAIQVQKQGRNRTITLAADTVPADRDFVLQWQSASSQPGVGLFQQRVDEQTYVMATITPPRADSVRVAPPRTMIFVIDNSGSMGGASMRAAKASLLYALTTLRPVDHFNVIRFDDTLTQLFSASVQATADNITIASDYTRGLQARGGTQMLPALKQALAGSDTDANTIRQVIFLTDGAITNESQMLAAIGQDGGRSRIFPIGIGSAPNQYLLSRMASVGRGSTITISTPQQVKTRMTQLLDRLRQPAVRNLSIVASDPALQLTPAQLPDLYAGETLTILGRTDKLRGQLTVQGFIGNRHWSRTIDLSSARPGQGIAKLWAKRRIRDVHTERLLGQLDADTAKHKITALGLRYALVTDHTSLVAVDATPSRPDDAPLTQAELPINLPAGWDFDTLFGNPASHGRDAAESASQPRRVAENQPLALPQTATNFATTLRRGLLLLGIGLLGLLLLRRRRAAA